MLALWEKRDLYICRILYCPAVEHSKRPKAKYKIKFFNFIIMLQVLSGVYQRNNQLIIQIFEPTFKTSKHETKI